ncbi:type IV pilin protein [Acinetobacter shaoyimingii]|uniref:type IV pilin protein n=1 Tax=Acinetobacter shaoyimingii TaxID=2715164 RepID=UPI0038779661
MKNGNVQGFTFIEFMIVIVIIGILVAIAYPNYQNYKLHGNRVNAQGEMLFIAGRMQAYKMTNGSYEGATVSDIYGGSDTFPKKDNPDKATPLYDLAFDPSPAEASGWTLVATPISTQLQASDGVICINDLGQKFWAKGATTCSLSNTSSWDKD